MKLQTKKALCLTILILSIITIVGTVSYAYFSATADVQSQQTAELITGTMTMKFMDNDNGIDQEINVGNTITKKFIIQNTGSLESSIDINWVDLINTYTPGSLSYTLAMSETENGEYSEIISKTDLPVSEVPKKATLAKNITLPSGATYYYNLVIAYNYLTDVNQNGDFDATFSTRFGAVDTNANTSTIKTDTMLVTFEDDLEINEKLNQGDTITKAFTISNKSTEEDSINLYWNDLVNTYAEGSLSYTLSMNETKDGPYKTVTTSMVPISASRKKTVLARNIKVPAGDTYYYNLEITRNAGDNESSANANLSTTFDVTDPKSSTNPVDKIIASSNGVRTNFDEPATTDEGIFEMEDDYGTSYYYRGAVTNNYVKFGKWADTEKNGDKAGKDMYWQIIRINGDGSLRIMYTGTQAYETGAYNSDMFIGEDGWNYSTGNYDAKYIGWMYGGTKGTESTSKELAQKNETNSDIKTFVDGWYKENIVDTGYSSAIADALFCNDRTTPGKNVSERTDDTGLGYGTNKTMYGAWTRFLTGGNSTNTNPRTNIKPTFKCPEKNDSFTVSDTTKGNGDLTYPVGLITADEIVTAGSGKHGTTNDKYYLYRSNNEYWSFTPHGSAQGASIFYISSNGGLSYYTITVGKKIAPVINISKEYAEKMTGEGTVESPYEIPINL